MKVKIKLSQLITSYGEVVGHGDKITLEVEISENEYNLLQRLLQESSDYNLNVEKVRD